MVDGHAVELFPIQVVKSLFPSENVLPVKDGIHCSRVLEFSGVDVYHILVRFPPEGFVEEPDFSVPDIEIESVVFPDERELVGNGLAVEILVETSVREAAFYEIDYQSCAIAGRLATM